MGIKKKIILQERELKELEKRELQIYACAKGALNNLLNIFAETKNKTLNADYIKMHLSPLINSLQEIILETRKSMKLIKKEEKLAWQTKEELKAIVGMLQLYQLNQPDKETRNYQEKDLEELQDEIGLKDQ